MRRWCATGCGKRATRDGDYCSTHDPMRLPTDVFPTAPLVELVNQRGGPMQCARDRSIRRAYERAVTKGQVRAHVADRLALRMLGVHPWEVWPSWFSDAESSSIKSNMTP